MAARPRRTERGKLLCLTCWNADGMLGGKLELKHFLNQHGVNICLLSETFLNPAQAFQLANCLPLDRQTDSRGRYRHPHPPLYSSPLSACSGPNPLGGYCHSSHIGWQTGENPCGLPFAFLPTDRSEPIRLFWHGIAGLDGQRPQCQTRGLELAAEHVILRDYADKNSCLIFGPDTPTTNPYNPSATPDVLDIMKTKRLTSLMYLTVCSALSSDHLPVLIDTMCCSSFKHPPDRPDFRHTEWANFQTHLEDQIPLNLELHNGMAIDMCVENLSGSVLKALAASTPKCRLRGDPRPPIPVGIQDEIHLKNPLWRQWQVTRDPTLRADVNHLQRSNDLRAQ